MPILSFQHKGLKQFFETGSKAGIKPEHAIKLRELAALHTAEEVNDMNIPGYRLYALSGNLAGRWAIDVSKNWRITFEFTNGNAYVTNYEDYH